MPLFANEGRVETDKDEKLGVKDRGIYKENGYIRGANNLTFPNNCQARNFLAIEQQLLRVLTLVTILSRELRSNRQFSLKYAYLGYIMLVNFFP